MNVLSDKSYWDSIHNQQSSERGGSFLWNKFKFLAKKILGPKCLCYYSDYLLWDVILPTYLPKQKGLKVLEIGSAPGETLVKLKQKFDYAPYGVEYSESGVELNRRIFIENGIGASNVIHADFLSSEFQQKYIECFDIVISVGFIEHFTNVEEIVKGHINVLAKGGHLVIIIPNLSGLNYLLSVFFNRQLMKMHNRKIMNKNVFCNLFDDKLLDVKLCKYFGTFDFGLFNTKKGSPLKFLLNFCKLIQAFLNVLFPFFFKDKGAESAFFSPYLIFIGIKK